MGPGYEYAVRFNNITTSGAITFCQIKAATCSGGLEILRASVTQFGNVTSLQERVQLVRKTGRATIPSFTPIILGSTSGDPTALAVASSCSCGSGVATAEGTDGDILVDEGFNILNGFLYLPVPEERIIVAPGAGVALKFPSTVTSTANTWTGGIYFREYR